MVKIIEVERKSDILTRPKLPCLSRYHAINLTAGCPYECRYCYARSFRSNPGAGVIHFYANSLRLLQEKLPRKRKKPELVYFSTACEPFMPIPQILCTLYGMMSMLLEHNISLLISTKSYIPEKFLSLFAKYSENVHVQVGLTTAHDNIRKLMEPHAASVRERVESIKGCINNGVRVEVRCDPLIPGLTDCVDSFEKLCCVVSECGVKNAAASYLFLRRSNFKLMHVSCEGWTFRDMAQHLYTHRISNYCGNSDIQIAAPEYRKQTFKKLQNVAESHGIKLRFCKCKNSDITSTSCHPLPVKSKTTLQQATLFS